jgi:SpoVK/Ycf46/Vps4 family AAA+-type ATPase
MASLIMSSLIKLTSAQLLTALDGVEGLAGVFVVAATNR